MNDLFYYKGNFYELLYYGKMKNPNGEWINSVTYQSTLTADIYTREQLEFFNKFYNVSHIMAKVEMEKFPIDLVEEPNLPPI